MPLSAVGNDAEVLVSGTRVTATDKRFAADVSSVNLSNHLFVRLVASKRRIVNVDFKYAIFETCYLRDCVFDSCDFTGCRFAGTNLNGSSFTGCKFDYVNFERTLIDNDVLETSCPSHENLKMRFARTLRMNYQQIGDAKSANKAISVELEATEIHLHKSWRSNESYYRRKYQSWNRVRVLLQWLEFKALDLIWGNGESPLKLLRTAIAVLLLISAIDAVAFRNANLVSSYVGAFVDAPATFLGTYSPPAYPKLYLAAIVFVRLVVFGFFMSIIIKRFNRR
jgi:hypothetical protein